MNRRAEIYVEATNAALNGFRQRGSAFTCYGINEGERQIHAFSRLKTSPILCSDERLLQTA